MKLRRREGGGRSIRNNRKKSKNDHRSRRISFVGCIIRLAFVLWVLLLIFGAWIILLFHQHHNNNQNNNNKINNGDKFSTEAVRNNEQQDVTTTLGYHHNDHDHTVPDSSSKMQLLRKSSGMQQQQPLPDYKYHNNKKKKVNPWMKNDNNNNNDRLMMMKKGLLYQKNPLLYKEECGEESYQHEIPHPYHGCEINTNNMIVSCTFQNLKIDTTKIISYEGGGESLDTPGIMGRSEDMEIPKYIKGAFQIILSNNNNNNNNTIAKPNIDDRIYQDNNTTFQKLRYIGDILNNLEVVVDGSDDDGKTKKKKMMNNDYCLETWSGTTLFITRYEYANLYHTLTDWWNAYFSLPPKIRNRRSSNRSKGKIQNEDNDNNNDDGDDKIHLVFLDAHASAGSLDEVWEKLMFGTKPIHVKNLPSSICFDKAILIPVGYRSELFPHKAKELSRLQRQHRDCPNRYLAKEFSDHVLKSYGLLSSSFDNDKNDNNMEQQQQSSNNYRHQVQKGEIVIIDRKPYVAHPRSVIEDGTTKRMIENLDELQHALLEDDIKGVASVKLIRLETMTFEEQLKSIRTARVLIGNHGAGLSHTMFMDPYTQIVLELNPVREFFSYLSDWKGIRYESWETSTKGTRLSSEDIEAIKKVVSQLLSG